MAKARPTNPIRLSVLDNLLDDDPEGKKDPQQPYDQSVRKLKDYVRRDLENLLNTRWQCAVWPRELPELARSLVSYGIPDFLGFDHQGDFNALMRAIEEAIATFEPRLRNVRVEAVPNPDRVDRRLKFRIEAVLAVEPIEHRVRFDSVLEPASGAFAVQGADS